MAIGDAADGFCVVVGGANSFFGLLFFFSFCGTNDRMGLRYWGSAGVGWECPGFLFVLGRWASWDPAVLLACSQRRMGCELLTAWSLSSRFCARDKGTLALEQKIIVYQSLGHV